ncbi:hypothetical protein BDQ17DRAFT_1177724, partial [Cyathus striatus]
IKKPPGQSNQPNSGGYNLKDALGWDQGCFEKIQMAVHKLANAKLDTMKCYSNQDNKQLEKVYQSAERRYTDLQRYENHWPIHEMLKSYLK